MNIKNDKQRYFQLILLVLSAGSIYPLLYLRTNFQTPMLEVFNINLAQLNELYALIGMMFVIGYAPSGWLCDKFSTKKLITFSLVTTGLLGIYMTKIPSFYMMKTIFILWGFTGVFTFWGALLKGVKLLAREDEQAKFFGILDGGRGITEAVLATIAMSIFSFFSRNGLATKTALINVIYMYSLFCIILSIANYFFLKDNTLEKDNNIIKQVKSNIFSEISMTFKNKRVILLALIIFSGYTLSWTTYSFSGYLTSKYETSTIVAGYISVIILWLRPLGGIGGGFLGDKKGRTYVLKVAMITASASLGLIVFLPSSMSLIVTSIFFIIFGFSQYVIKALYWSLLDDCKVPVFILGLSIGIISFIGYLPDLVSPLFSKILFDIFPNETQAYSIYFLISSLMGIVGVVSILFFEKSMIEKQQFVTSGT